MKYTVLAINKDGYEILRRFETLDEATAYANLCEQNDCDSIRVANNETKKVEVAIR